MAARSFSARSKISRRPCTQHLAMSSMWADGHGPLAFLRACSLVQLSLEVQSSVRSRSFIESKHHMKLTDQRIARVRHRFYSEDCYEQQAELGRAAANC